MGIDLICHLLTILMIYKVSFCKLTKTVDFIYFCDLIFGLMSIWHWPFDQWGKKKTLVSLLQSLLFCTDLLWWLTCYCVYWTRSAFHYCINKDISQLNNLDFAPEVCYSSFHMLFISRHGCWITCNKLFFTSRSGVLLWGIRLDSHILLFIYCKAYWLVTSNFETSLQLPLFPLFSL